MNTAQFSSIIINKEVIDRPSTLTSSQFLKIISNDHIFPNPGLLIKVLKEIPLETVKKYPGQNKMLCSDRCTNCFLWCGVNGYNYSCNDIICAKPFNELYDVSVIIEMKKMIDKHYFMGKDGDR